MALAAGTIWEFRSSATANNVNSGGFNHLNANFLTDLTTDSSTGNTASPVCSSASYNFVAGDVGAWLYVKSGTNWNAGWYQITSVASNKATVNATIGSAVINSNGYFQPSTVLGVATVATPTNGTWGIDYSQQDAAKLAITDLAINGAVNTSVTSAGTPFHVAYVGNLIHTTAGTGFTQGWFEVVSVSGVTATLDRSAGTLGSTGGTSYLGGSLSLNSTLDDDVFEAMIGENTAFFKNGTFVLGESIAIASASATSAAPVSIEGYNTIRGDNPSLSNCPLVTCAALTVTPGNYKKFRNLKFTGTAADIIISGNGNLFVNCSFKNTSTTTNRYAFRTTNFGNKAIRCEFVSQNGYGASSQHSAAFFLFCYFHDSNYGLMGNSANTYYLVADSCLFSHNRTGAFYSSLSHMGLFSNCTFYGRQSKIGTGILMDDPSANYQIVNSIISGFVTGVSSESSNDETSTSHSNNYYNNTTDVTNFYKGINDTSLDPQFTNASEISGTTATTSGSVLTQSGGDFSAVEDNVDYLHVISGTGVTTGGYLITSHTGTTLTVNNALGTSSGGDVVYFVSSGRNFKIGTNLKAGFSYSFNSDTTSYIDIGAVQREELTSGGGAYASF